MGSELFSVARLGINLDLVLVAVSLVGIRERQRPYKRFVLATRMLGRSRVSGEVPAKAVEE